ncbi:hypothetical protein HMI56_006351 [Coelomomyces lativittatus]|nr:hypothetical protein HMI56_006351 [Coelomomyces lativittatus]
MGKNGREVIETILESTLTFGKEDEAAIDNILNTLYHNVVGRNGEGEGKFWVIDDVGLKYTKMNSFDYLMFHSIKYPYNDLNKAYTKVYECSDQEIPEVEEKESNDGLMIRAAKKITKLNKEMYSDTLKNRLDEDLKEGKEAYQKAIPIFFNCIHFHRNGCSLHKIK